MKLATVIPYLKKKNIDHVTHVFSSTEISIFCNIKKYRYRMHFDNQFLILLTFFKYLKIVLINMVKILMMSTKVATSGLLKIYVFWKKEYGVKISVYDVTNKILWRDWNFNIDLVIKPKFGNSSIPMRKVIITLILSRFDKKNTFLKSGFGSSSIIWDWQ